MVSDDIAKAARVGLIETCRIVEGKNGLKIIVVFGDIRHPIFFIILLIIIECHCLRCLQLGNV